METMTGVQPMRCAVRGATGRLRPCQSDYRNTFFDGGNSFPSNHSALVWEFGSVVAHEYHRPLPMSTSAPPGGKATHGHPRFPLWEDFANFRFFCVAQ